MIHDDWRRLFQDIKKMTLEQFVKKINKLYSNAWHKNWIQYEEAMKETLPPSLAEKLRASHRRIVTEYDGMSWVEVDLKEMSEHDFIAVIQDNRRLGQARMIELVLEHCTNK